MQLISIYRVQIYTSVATDRVYQYCVATDQRPAKYISHQTNNFQYIHSFNKTNIILLRYVFKKISKHWLLTFMTNNMNGTAITFYLKAHSY